MGISISTGNPSDRASSKALVNMQNGPLECRIVITHRSDRRIDLGMYDPVSGRYEALGTHGPSQRDIDRAVLGLKRSIEDAGHRLTFCERSSRFV